MLFLLAAIVGSVMAVVNWIGELFSPSPEISPVVIKRSDHPKLPNPPETAPTVPSALVPPQGSTAKNSELSFVKGKRVALRSLPGKQGAVLARLDTGHELQIVERGKNWVKVRDPLTRQVGWIASSLLSSRPQKTAARPEAKPIPRSKPVKPQKKVKTVGSGCDSNYSGDCVPIASDVDCAGGSGNGPAYVRGPVYVTGSDIYDLDRDGDGVGCE